MTREIILQVIYYPPLNVNVPRWKGTLDLAYVLKLWDEKKGDIFHVYKSSDVIYLENDENNHSKSFY